MRTSRFTERLNRYNDELKWLYCELYHNDMQAYDYFISVLKKKWQERKHFVNWMK